MKTEALNPLIIVTDIENQKYLKFTFSGQLNEKEAINAIKEWERIFKLDREEKFNLIWECTNMTGYNPGARIAWQKALKNLNHQISEIWVITNSALINNAVRIISMITKYPIKVVQSETEIPILFGLPIS